MDEKLDDPHEENKVIIHQECPKGIVCLILAEEHILFKENKLFWPPFLPPSQPVRTSSSIIPAILILSCSVKPVTQFF